MILEATVCAKTIRAEIIRLDSGLDIGLYGGDQTHVGAVSLAEPGNPVQTLQRPAHKDAAVSEHWAVQLAEAMQCPVCVRCGIHYECFHEALLPEILSGCEELLKRLLHDLKSGNLETIGLRQGAPTHDSKVSWNRRQRNMEVKFCDRCENHCPADALKCGKGRRHFGLKEPGGDSSPVTMLLRKCGHALHHGNELPLAVLTEAEQAQLQTLLEKLTAHMANL